MPCWRAWKTSTICLIVHQLTFSKVTKNHTDYHCVIHLSGEIYSSAKLGIRMGQGRLFEFWSIFLFYEFSTKAFVLNPGSSLNKLRKITENLGLNVNSRLALYWHINRKSPRKKKTEKTGSHINQTDTKLPLHIKYYYQICSFICVCACVCVSTRQLIPLMLKIHRCGSASVMWVTQTAVQASLYSQTERKKDNHKHNVDTTAAKWCTNTFYQPPLTS